MSPSSSRSCITLRTEAGDKDIGSMRDRCREPTGSPEERYESTMLRKISRERALSVVNALDSAGRSVGSDMRQAWLELAPRARRRAFWACNLKERRELPNIPRSIRNQPRWAAFFDRAGRFST